LLKQIAGRHLPRKTANAFRAISWIVVLRTIHEDDPRNHTKHHEPETSEMDLKKLRAGPPGINLVLVRVISWIVRFGLVQIFILDGNA